MAYTAFNNSLPGLRANSTGLATSQFLFGKLASTAGQVVLSGALNSTTGPTTIVGVIMNKPGANEEVEFVISGVAKVKVATTDIAIGDWITINSTSLGTEATPADNQFVVGRALEASSAANDIISVLLGTPGGARY